MQFNQHYRQKGLDFTMTFRKQTLALCILAFLPLIIFISFASRCLLSTTHMQSEIATTAYLIFAFTLSSAIISSIILFLFRRQVLSRLSQLSSSVTMIGRQDSHHGRVDNLGNDEIGNLASTINRMLDELARSQNRLKDSEEQFRSLFENALTGNFIATPDCRIVICNVAFARLLGYNSVAEVLAATSVDFFPCKQQKENCQARLKQLKKLEFVESEMNRKDGTTITTLGNLEGIFDDEGTIIFVRGYLLDITEKKQTLENIQQMNAQLSRQAQELHSANVELESRVAERTADLKKSHEEMENVSLQLLWAEERERMRIAGELHDHVGQSLLLAKMKLDALASAIPSETHRLAAEEASALVASSLQDIRTLTVRIRPPILDTAGIETALEWLCSSINNDYALEIDFLDDGNPKPLAAEERYSLYQVVRELLLNVVKHAGADKTHLSLSVAHHSLVVRIIDNGVGFEHADIHEKQGNGGAYGLYIVQQRIEQMGGSIVVESTPGQGTTVALVVPLKEAFPEQTRITT